MHQHFVNLLFLRESIKLDLNSCRPNLKYMFYTGQVEIKRFRQDAQNKMHVY